MGLLCLLKIIVYPVANNNAYRKILLYDAPDVLCPEDTNNC